MMGIAQRCVRTCDDMEMKFQGNEEFFWKKRELFFEEIALKKEIFNDVDDRCHVMSSQRWVRMKS